MLIEDDGPSSPAWENGPPTSLNSKVGELRAYVPLLCAWFEVNLCIINESAQMKDVLDILHILDCAHSQMAVNTLN